MTDKRAFCVIVIVVDACPPHSVMAYDEGTCAAITKQLEEDGRGVVGAIGQTLAVDAR